MTTGEDEGGGECEGCGVRPSRHRTQHARLGCLRRRLPWLLLPLSTRRSSLGEEARRAGPASCLPAFPLALGPTSPLWSAGLVGHLRVPKLETQDSRETMPLKGLDTCAPSFPQFWCHML